MSLWPSFRGLCKKQKHLQRLSSSVAGGSRLGTTSSVSPHLAQTLRRSTPAVNRHRVQLADLADDGRSNSKNTKVFSTHGLESEAQKELTQERRKACGVTVFFKFQVCVCIHVCGWSTVEVSTARPMMIGVLVRLDDKQKLQHGWTCPESHDEVVLLRALRAKKRVSLEFGSCGVPQLRQYPPPPPPPPRSSPLVPRPVPRLDAARPLETQTGRDERGSDLAGQLNVAAGRGISSPIQPGLKEAGAVTALAKGFCTDRRAETLISS